MVPSCAGTVAEGEAEASVPHHLCLSVRAEPQAHRGNRQRGGLCRPPGCRGDEERQRPEWPRPSLPGHGRWPRTGCRHWEWQDIPGHIPRLWAEPRCMAGARCVGSWCSEAPEAPPEDRLT